MLAVARCLSVRLSVTHRYYCVLTTKRVIKLFRRLVATLFCFFFRTILAIYSDGDPHHGGVECRRGYEKVAIFDQYVALSQK